jgi:hypothetical protein
VLENVLDTADIVRDRDLSTVTLNGGILLSHEQG